MNIVEFDNQDGTHCVTVAEKPLLCTACGHNRYHDRESMLNSRAAEFFGFAWANKTATNYICAQCGYIHWFLNR